MFNPGEKLPGKSRPQLSFFLFEQFKVGRVTESPSPTLGYFFVGLNFLAECEYYRNYHLLLIVSVVLRSKQLNGNLILKKF